MSKKQNDYAVYSFTVTSACILIMYLTAIVMPAQGIPMFGMVVILQIVRALVMFPLVAKVTGKLKYFFIAFIDAVFTLYCVTRIPSASQPALVIPLVVFMQACIYKIRVDRK